MSNYSEDFQSYWGWRQAGLDDDGNKSWLAQGSNIGWIECDDIYLEPNTTFTAIQKLTSDQGSGFPTTPSTLWKRLDHKDYMASKEEENWLKIRRVIEGQRRYVIHLKKSVLSIEKSALSDPTEPRNNS